MEITLISGLSAIIGPNSGTTPLILFVFVFQALLEVFLDTEPDAHHSAMFI